jgi:hypothetical protein
LTTQSKLSPRQARWLETISEFDFSITYVLGCDNVLADALSHMYSHEPKGTIHMASEYVSVEDEDETQHLLLNYVSAPMYTSPPLFLGAIEARRLARIALSQVHALVPTTSSPPRAKPSRTKAQNPNLLVPQLHPSSSHLIGIDDKHMNPVIDQTITGQSGPNEPTGGNLPLVTPQLSLALPLTASADWDLDTPQSAPIAHTAPIPHTAASPKRSLNPLVPSASTISTQDSRTRGRLVQHCCDQPVSPG